MKPIHVEPINQKLLLDWEPAQKQTRGGLWLPDTVVGDTKHRPKSGKILAKGKHPDTERFEIGDIVVAHARAGTELLLNGEDYLLIEAEDVIAFADEPLGSQL